MDFKITVMSMFLMTLVSFALCVETQDDHLESSSGSTIQKHETVADAVNEFGYKLTLTMLKKAKDQNVVISPTSIAGLLAMTLLGTIGRTHEELAAALGFSQDIIESRKNHAVFGELLQSLNSNDSDSKTLYADAIFVDTHTRIRELYGGYLRRVYNGEALGVDFTRTVEVKDMINHDDNSVFDMFHLQSGGWVDSHTEGKIDNFLQKTLPPTTKAVLLSALYFRGQWKYPFHEELTLRMNFTKPSKTIVMADLMANMGHFRYKFSVQDGLHMIALPYNDSITTLYVLQPRGAAHRGETVHDLMMRLNYTRVNQIIDEMKTSECVLRLPKMDLKIESKLENHLKALGVQSLFTPGQANFALMVDSNTITNSTEEILSRITEDNEAQTASEARSVKEVLGSLPNPGIYVDSLIHDVKLTMNEYGTEAVAATSGVLARTAHLFLANEPFYMFIRNERTKLVTFSAVINDPTA